MQVNLKQRINNYTTLSLTNFRLKFPFHISRRRFDVIRNVERKHNFKRVKYFIRLGNKEYVLRTEISRTLKIRPKAKMKLESSFSHALANTILTYHIC